MWPTIKSKTFSSMCECSTCSRANTQTHHTAPLLEFSNPGNWKQHVKSLSSQYRVAAETTNHSWGSCGCENMADRDQTRDLLLTMRMLLPSDLAGLISLSVTKAKVCNHVYNCHRATYQYTLAVCEYSKEPYFVGGIIFRHIFTIMVFNVLKQLFVISWMLIIWIPLS